MTASLRALLANIIDYAGMFPPAQLPMDEAIRNYARYRTEPESWMLGRFICPAARLNELSPYVDELFRLPLSISALGRGGNDAVSFVEGVNQDLVEIDLFRARHGSRVTVDVFETKLPPIGPEMLIVWGIGRLADKFMPRLQVYYEQALLGAMPIIAAKHPGAGYKIRCGGNTPDSIPSTSDLSKSIFTAQELKVPIKFTAGLHHPIRHFDSNLETKMHGFVSVFAAGVLASTAQGQWELTVQWILEDEDPTHFRFDNDGMSWRDLRATIPQIESARRNNVISFGSCSFDEPREDLKALGWL